MALLEGSRSDTARVRDLATAAFAPLLVGYTAIAVVFALVTALAPKADVSADGVLLAALPGWLAAHQVPLLIGGRELGVLPLLPTVLLALVVGRVARAVAARTGVRGPRAVLRVVAVVALAHASAGLVVALLLTGPVGADPLAAFYYPALISGAACAVALAGRSELLDLAAGRVDVLAARGLRAGLLGVAALLLLGAVVLVVGLLTSFGTVRALFTGGPGAGVGLLLLSAGYLPNAVVAAVGFAAGPGVGIGAVSVAPLGFAGGPLPAVPLLGALPTSPHGWWPLLLLLPAAVGALVGWVLREVDESPVARLRAVAVAAVVVATVFAVLAGSAGGALAGGPFDPVDLRAAALSLALVGWVGVPGALVAWFAGTHPSAPGLIGPDDPDEPDPDEPDHDEPDTESDGTGSDDADPDGDAAVDAEPDDGAEPEAEAEPEDDAAAGSPPDPDESEEDEAVDTDRGTAAQDR